MLVLEGNLFHGFRGSSAVMNGLPLPVYKNIVCKALMYVGRTGQLLKQCEVGTVVCEAHRLPLGASGQALLLVKILACLKKGPSSFSYVAI